MTSVRKRNANNAKIDLDQPAKRRKVIKPKGQFFNPIKVERQKFSREIKTDDEFQEFEDNEPTIRFLEKRRKLIPDEENEYKDVPATNELSDLRYGCTRYNKGILSPNFLTIPGIKEEKIAEEVLQGSTNDEQLTNEQCNSVEPDKNDSVEESHHCYHNIKHVKYFCRRHKVKYIVEKVRKEFRENSRDNRDSTVLMRRFKSFNMLDSAMFIDTEDSAAKFDVEFEPEDNSWYDAAWNKVLPTSSEQVISPVEKVNPNGSSSFSDEEEECEYIKCHLSGDFFEYEGDNPDNSWESNNSGVL